MDYNLNPFNSDESAILDERYGIPCPCDDWERDYHPHIWTCHHRRCSRYSAADEIKWLEVKIAELQTENAALRVDADRYHRLKSFLPITRPNGESGQIYPMEELYP